MEPLAIYFAGLPAAIFLPLGKAAEPHCLEAGLTATRV